MRTQGFVRGFAATHPGLLSIGPSGLEEKFKKPYSDF
jgi:hypothetical protein